MVEGSDAALDAAIYIRGDGGERILIPVRSEDAQADPEPEPAPEPEPDVDVSQDVQQPADIEINFDRQNRQPKNRWFYMKEFVARVDKIFQAMQATEALPDSTSCAECSEPAASWRCEDCIGRRLLCRFCMRQSHFANPFHRIQCWTGTYFRRAALWEVGVYLTLPHQHGRTICPNLFWQQQMLEKFQKNKDKDSQRQHTPAEPNEMHYADRADSEPDPGVEAARDAAAMQYLDQLLAGQTPDEVLEEDDEDELVDTEADVQDMDAGTAGFTNYMNEPPDGDPHHLSYSSIPVPPNCDALNNQYIRVVHTNGMHHIALVSCTCQGHERIITDLIYAGWVPTSFVRVRTIFTAAVLDHFRYCNLEMRSSAYQFFQLLRRVTNSLSPSKVVNLYHELRRLSRLWRWVKKLRWAGFAQRVGQPLDPKPGELGNFCPACPQVGINVEENWTDDPNRWVYRRVLTADGNFKADHVRQKLAADDVWLSDGLGMTTTKSDYNAFLQTAKERNTVSVNK
jgi:hypothetical protein